MGLVIRLRFIHVFDCCWGRYRAPHVSEFGINRVTFTLSCPPVRYSILFPAGVSFSNYVIKTCRSSCMFPSSKRPIQCRMLDKKIGESLGTTLLLLRYFTSYLTQGCIYLLCRCLFGCTCFRLTTQCTRCPS